MASSQKTYSRLDQLLTLLENGTTQATRSAAAKQLGIIQKKHPHELNMLLKRLLGYVRHKEWDARVSGAEAIKCVVSEVPPWSATNISQDGDTEDETEESTKLKISNVSMNKIMAGAELLLCSSGEEFELKSDGDLAEDLMKARRRIERKMGLTVGGNTSLGLSSNDLFVDDDLILHREDNAAKSNMAVSKPYAKGKAPCAEVMVQITEGMSSREKNRVKRRAKLLQKQNSVETTRENEGHQAKKKRKLDQQDQSAKQQEQQIPPSDTNKWPFEWICEDLLTLLFSPTWEWRHGSCLALRDILTVHGGGAGTVLGSSKTKMAKDNNAWLEDAAVRMLCVMVLDRFGDFVSDQMIAPVRESCAQALAVTTKYLRNDTVSEILNILVYLTKHEEWEVRHAGYLGIKYTLAVREDLREENISRCLLPLINGLQDRDGDVRSVSADALRPIVEYLINTKAMEKNLRQLSTVLCGSLYDLDELTASTRSLLTLLSKLISSLPANHISSFMDVRSVMSQMWAFTKHSTPAVRKAALQTIDTILDSLQSQAVPWFSELVKDGLWSLAECCILEAGHEIQQISVKVWSKFCERTSQLALCEFCRHFFDDLMNLVAQPDNVPFAPEAWKGFMKSMVTAEEEKEVLKYIGGTPSPSRPDQCETRSEAVSRTRQNFAKMLGVLCAFMAHNDSQQQFIHQTVASVSHRLLTNINSRFALHRIVGCMVLFHWWELKVSVPDAIYSTLLHALNEDLYFNEISSLFIQVQSEIKTVLQLASQHMKSPLPLEAKQVYSLEDALLLHSELDALLQGSQAATLDDSNKRLGSIAKEAQENNHALQRTVRSYLVLSLSSASYQAPVDSRLSVLHLSKINPIIRPLMEGLKEEENKVHRNAIAQALTYLLDICRKREPCPNPKLIRNISYSLRGDETVTPNLMDPVAKVSDDVLTHCKCDKKLAVREAILTLVKKHATSLHITANRKKNDDNQHNLPGKENREIARSGSLASLQRICDHFGTNVFKALPQLWDLVCEPLKEEDVSSNGNSSEKENIDEEAIDKKMMSLVIIEAMASVLEEELVKKKVLDLLPSISNLIWSPYSAVRYVCSRCYAALTKRIPGKMMEKFITEILPSIESSELFNRMGVIEVIANIVDSLGPDVLPYSVILIVPLLGRMSDQDTQVRLVATRCFASLMQYLPVESSVPDSHELSKELMSKRDRDRRFLEQLLDSSSLDEYPVPVPIHAELRPYQEDGIKWMAFLNRYKLHGLLCDDMGLGKTLQSICILASDHFLREQSYEKTKNISFAPLPSLVICPPTLTGHWVDEVEKFCDRKHLNPLHYVGTPSDRMRLQAKLPYHNLVIASYEVVRNDVSFFRNQTWNYCILDEGHIIRNAKNKLTVCVKSIRANHRLILTGTPIQNSVLELWSLFDFLMPGFLGSEQEFNFHYSKPILASRDVKSTSKEQEEGVMAMEALHKQVLPFMLRRMKEDVLQDLPPKIIQDYYCSLSPLQVRLYEDFSKTRAKREVDSSIARADAEQPQGARGSQTCHVFQALQYLQKVCNHPALVLTPCHPEYKRVAQDLGKDNSSLHDIQHSSKLLALMQLLTDCGIGASGDMGLDSIVGQHRALIFCQHKSMLDIVEHDLLRKHMPAVTFLRLDGSVAANNRHSIVSKFNNDPSIDLLLLTTKVGGLGLNLTGADTVIFIEHDWNPTVDMQAMDRAHRIGQKRVVNVYRLITRGTLEEKIMSLQKFKINIANTVITADNSSVRSMETNQLLDLFTMSKNSEKGAKSSKDKSGKGFRALIDEIGELWDQNQYDTEYNLDGFMEKLVS